MSDREQLELIRNLTLAQIAQLRAEPKPTYSIDGQTISWTAYVRSLMETHTAPLAAAMAASKPRPQPVTSPVRPTPMATVSPFSIWARNTARETVRGKEAILSGE